MYKKNIQKLIKNIPKPDTPMILDVVLEGGAFNGSYELGGLYVLKQLEHHGYIKIERFSGVSIGAILAFSYITNTLGLYTKCYNKIREQWRDELSLTNVKKYISNIIKKKVNSKIFDKFKKDKLFITYFDTETNTQIVKSEYSNIQEFKETLLYSINIPYIMFQKDSSNNYIEERFIDGAQPHIFHNRDQSSNKKILYLSINHYSKIKNMFSTKNENTPQGRILEGILDCYNFFLYNKRNRLCSYVNEWGFIDYVSIRINKGVVSGLLYVLTLIRFISKFLYPLYKHTMLYRIISPLLQNMTKDFLLFISF